jgi:ATP-dependent Clp protease adapter protein ClpS
LYVLLPAFQDPEDIHERSKKAMPVPMAKVILYNDDVNSFQDVVSFMKRTHIIVVDRIQTAYLEQITLCSFEKAENLAKRTHMNGAVVAFSGMYE